MKTCELIKVTNANCDYEFYFKVKGIGYTKVFNRLWEAEKFIASKGYRYNYSEIFVEEL